MTRFRTHWLALVGAMLLLGLSVSSAFGAHPQHPDNRGNAVSSFVHDLVFGSDEETDEEDEDADEEQDEEGAEEEEEEEEQPTDEEDQDGFKNHGHCVREVAWSLEVGGLNENHGGAVSEAARVTCRDLGEDEETTEGEEGDGGDESLESTDSDTARGKSAQAHERAPGKNKSSEQRGNGHGNGHGRSGR